MAKKKRKFHCAECDNEFTINYSGKDPLSCCPFCGEELLENDLDTQKLKTTFEEYDEEDDIYDEDAEEPDEEND